MLSSTLILDHWAQYGERVLDCQVFISRSIHDAQNQQVLHSACALLNSGGGLLRMHNVQHAAKVQSKDLDTWWSGMESKLADILSGDDLCNYFDFVGNYDDKDLFLFVKTAEHLCTLNYHCRLPTDTATHYVTYASAVKLLAKTGNPASLSELPPVPTEYHYGQVKDTLKQEGTQIQFKLLANNKDQAKSFADRICYYCVKYISAFANHYGGHIYFGIEDSSAAVLGELLEASEEYKITHRIQRMMKDTIWGDTSMHAEQGKHWDVHFYPVVDCPTKDRRRVVVVSVCKFPGGVFTHCPDSYVLGAGDQLDKLIFSQWKSEVLNQSKVRPELHTRFVKVALSTPFCRLIYSLPHTLQAAKERVLKVCSGFNFEPKHYLDTLEDPHLRASIQRIVSTFAGEPHLAVPLQCWRTHFKTAPHEDMRSTLLVFSQLYGVHLLLFVTSHLNSDELWTVAQRLAVEVKGRLVRHGGCGQRLAITTHLLSLADPLMLHNFQASIDSSIFPPTFALNADKLDKVVTSLLVSVASYSPCRQQGPLPSPPDTSHLARASTPVSPTPPSATHQALSDCHFLLTCDQLQLLWTRQFCKELWVHGPPGAGKTVAALEMIQELVHRGCRAASILYLAENPLLCAYIRSFKLCKVKSRRELMEDSTKPARWAAQYKDVRNVIVDEAQNFKDRDGDWYFLAEKLANQNQDTAVAAHEEETSLEAAPGHGSERESGTGTLSEAAASALPTAETIIGTSFAASPSKNSHLSKDCDKSPPQSNPAHSVSSPKKHWSSPSGAASEDLTRGYFWVFMDYAQKVHKFKAGLPGLIGKNNFMLSEISRNSKEIFDYAMKFMSKPSKDVVGVADDDVQGKGKEKEKKCVADEPVLGHGYQNGRGVEVLKCEAQSLQGTLTGVLTSFLGSGVKPQDIAILVSKRGEKEPVQAAVKHLTSAGDAELTSGQAGGGQVTVDTVRAFSGLDKPVVIGLEPHADHRHADLDKFLVNLVTRAKDGLVIITTSDELMDRLRQSQ